MQKPVSDLELWEGVGVVPETNLLSSLPDGAEEVGPELGDGGATAWWWRGGRI